MKTLKKLFNYYARYFDKIVDLKSFKKFIQKLKIYKTDHELIRLGDENDGGYLVPNDLKGIKYCFSAGVGELIQFEKDCLKKFNIISYLCDFNKIPKSLSIENFDYCQKKIETFSDSECISFDDWIDSKKIEENDEIILKVDIERSEFETLLNISERNLKKIRILIIEFHNLRDIRNKSFFRITNSLISRLNKFFYLLHMHPNNSSKQVKIHKYEVPDIVEFTYLRKDRTINLLDLDKLLPNKLDRKNILSKKDIILDPNIYR
tara:strand:- start:56 stop:844 length:789 start_codon:yes stop_codon:yes gene_type:complete